MGAPRRVTQEGRFCGGAGSFLLLFFLPGIPYSLPLFSLLFPTTPLSS